jgi:hypothetical protein
MSAHTPGPWHLLYEGVIENERGDVVLSLPFESYREFNCQSIAVKANQRLIAAAPELLDALKEMVRMYEEVQPAGGYQGVYEMAQEAIDKATTR